MSSFFKSPSGPPKPFKDLGKQANDLLKKDFPLNEKYEWKAEFNAPSALNGTFTGSLTKNPKEGQNAGDVSYKIPLKLGTFTTKFDLARNLKLEHNKKNFPVKGFDITEELVLKFKEELFTSGSFKLGCDYRRDWVNGSFTFNRGFGSKANLTSALTLGTPELALGLETDISDNLEVKSLNGIFSFVDSRLSATLFWKSKRQNDQVFNNTTGTNFYFKSSQVKDLAVGGELEYKLSDNDNASPNPTLAFGAIWKPEDSITVKGRLLSTGFLGVSLNSQWSSSVSMTYSADVDVKNPTAVDALKHAFKLVLSFD